ncbi:HEPN domain-containing protein [Methanocella paludicola]|nr:HEPN domain-containing protein [Methanocella paludicola]
MIKSYSASKEEIIKELGQSDNDLVRAKETIKAGDHKWSTIQAYYSMFHAARAVLLSTGYREKSHKCMLFFLESLVDEGRLEPHFAREFRSAMFLREDADYEATYSEQSARDTVENASLFIVRMKNLL